MDLRRDAEEGFSYMETALQQLVLEEFTNLVAADADGLKTSFATSDEIITGDDSDLDGVVGAAEMVPPRNVTVTSSTHADVTAVTVTFVGRVRNDRGELVAQTDTVLITAGGGATDVGVKAFAFIDSYSIPAMDGAGGALTIGFGVKVGLSKKLRSAAGGNVVLNQITDGSVVTNGTFVAATTAAPHGTWAPNTAANGAHDYSILYAADLRA